MMIINALSSKLLFALILTKLQKLIIFKIIFLLRKLFSFFYFFFLIVK
jgi:hypothetical protein